MILKTLGSLLAFGLLTHSAAAATCGSYPYSLTNGTTADASQVMANFNYVLNCVNNLSVNVLPAQGRLTLTSHTPVLAASATGQSTLYYDAYLGNAVTVYNGSSDVQLTIGSNQISDTLSASGTGEALSGGVFDEWAIGVSGTLTLCHATNGSGGGWGSDTGGSNTGRGTGYTQLDNHTRSYLTNANSIPNCYNGTTNEGPIAQNEATYLGTFYTTANGQTGISFGGSASGGTAGLIGLWNYYNRVTFGAQVIDSGTSYTYSSATIRQARASSGNQVTVVVGVQEDVVKATYSPVITPAASNAAVSSGIGLDSTSAFKCQPSFTQIASGGASNFSASASCSFYLLGLHTISANEQSDGTNSNTFDLSNRNELDASMRY